MRWFKPGTGEASEVTLDQPPGTIVPTSDPDRILVAGARGILELDVPGRKLTGRVLAETPEEHGVGACGSRKGGGILRKLRGS